MHRLGRILFGFFAMIVAIFLPAGRQAHDVASPSERADGVSQALRDGHDPSEPPPKWVGIFVAGLFLTIITTMILVHWLQTAIGGPSATPAVTQNQQSFRHAPYAESDIGRAWVKVNQATKANLETYHWVDRRAGKIGVPIKRAMDLIAREGLPARVGKAPEFPEAADEMSPLFQTEKINEVTGTR